MRSHGPFCLGSVTLGGCAVLFGCRVTDPVSSLVLTLGGYGYAVLNLVQGQ
jgi:hypothetical protein